MRTARGSYASFFGGTACVWGAVMVFLVAEFANAMPAPNVFLVICGGSLVASLVLTCRTLSEDNSVIKSSLPGGEYDTQTAMLEFARQLTYRTPPASPGNGRPPF